MNRTAMTARRSTFRRQARARFESGERELQPVVKKAISEYLALLRSNAERSPVLTAAAGAKPKPSAADVEANTAADAALFSDDDASALLDTLDQKGLFGAILDRTIMPALKQQLVPILQAGMSRPDTEASLTTWRNDWLAQRRQELLDVPDAITEQLRTELRGAAAAKGTSVDDARDLVDSMLDDGYPSWDGRAQLIARTETVGANNQGSLASMTAVADADNLAGTKTWLATSDDRTRPDHAEIDGTEVGLSDTFDVGGVTMNGPGDNAGGAAQVCNCRCTLTYAFSPADTGDSSSTDGDNSGDNGGSEADSGDGLTAGSADQPRAANGEFGSGGEAAEAPATFDAAAGSKDWPKKGFETVEFGPVAVDLSHKELSTGAETTQISLIKTSEDARGQGFASKALDVICQNADRQSRMLTLTPDPIAGPGAMSKTALTSWYKEAGFVKNKDPEISDTMVRFPGGDSVTAAAADTSAPTGVAVMAKLSATDAARAAVANGEAPDAMHVTLGYLAKPAADYTPEEQAAIVDRVGKAVASLVPFPADAFATAHFNPEDDEREPCAVVLVQSDELAAAHDAVSAALGEDSSTTFPIYIPHVTIAYNADPSVIPDGIAGSSFTFDRVVVGWAGTEIPAGVDPAADTGDDSMTAATEAPVTAPTTAPPAVPATPPEATGGDTATGTVPDASLEPSGVTWSGPLAILDTPSSDGRVISSTGGTIRPLPQPLSWQRESQPEHWTSIIIGRVLSVEVRGDQLWGTGDYLDPNINFDVAQAMAQVDAGMGFVSVDLAVQAVGFRDAETLQPIDPALFDGAADVLEEAVEWEFGGATLISFAAFADARITNDVPADDAEPVTVSPMEVPVMGTFAAATPEQSTIADDGLSITLSDGTSAAVGDPVAWAGADGETEVGTLTAINSDTNTVDVTPTPDPDDGTEPPAQTVDVAALIPVPAEAGKDGMGGEASLLASSEVRPYTAKFFGKRDLPGPTPLTVDTATGEVFGHLATWGECHLGKLMEGKCVTAPPAPDGDYSYFHLSDVQTDEGLMSVGKISLGAGHAGRGGMRFALAHYDNSATAVSVVRAYDDDYGIQVAGQIIHDTPSAKVEELMRSPLSGDWRGVPDASGTKRLRLTAALAVNSPGFAVRRPIVGMSGSEQISLVAAGIVEIPDEEPAGIRLPSGVVVARADFEVLTAAAIEAVERKGLDASEDEVALARARFTLLHGGRAAS